jgi:hypothetical protein
MSINTREKEEEEALNGTDALMFRLRTFGRVHGRVEVFCSLIGEFPDDIWNL